MRCDVIHVIHPFSFRSSLADSGCISILGSSLRATIISNVALRTSVPLFMPCLDHIIFLASPSFVSGSTVSTTSAVGESPDAGLRSALLLATLLQFDENTTQHTAHPFKHEHLAHCSVHYATLPDQST